MIDYSGLPFGKGEPRAAEKRRADRQFDAKRELARYKAYRHFGGCCAFCGVPLKLKPSEARHALEIAHANEVLSRALGGDATDEKNMVILCARHHQQFTNGTPKLQIEICDESLGTFGWLRFIIGDRRWLKYGAAAPQREV